MSTTGPNFAFCGRPVTWTDQAAVDDRFRAAIDIAASTLNVDIELVRWTTGEELETEYLRWWNIQSRAVRREIAGRHLDNLKATVRRRTDSGTGDVICYVRFDRVRVLKAAAA